MRLMEDQKGTIYCLITAYSMHFCFDLLSFCFDLGILQTNCQRSIYVVDCILSSQINNSTVDQKNFRRRLIISARTLIIGAKFSNEKEKYKKLSTTIFFHDE